MNILKYIFPSLRPKVKAKPIVYNMGSLYIGDICSGYRVVKSITGYLEHLQSESNIAYLRDHQSGLLWQVNIETLKEVK